MVYLHYLSCLRYTILVENPRIFVVVYTVVGCFHFLRIKVVSLMLFNFLLHYQDNNMRFIF